MGALRAKTAKTREEYEQADELLTALNSFEDSDDVLESDCGDSEEEGHL